MTLLVGIVGCATPGVTEPKYSEGKVISLVENWLLAQAQTQQARDVVEDEITNLQATYQGSGIWEASGNGKWKIYEESGIVQPVDDKARGILKSITDANQLVSATAQTPTLLSNPSVASAVDKVRPAVVRIVTAHGIGSGMIIDEAGHVLTNNHVVEDSQTATVVLIGGQELSASVLGRDEIRDLAILKVNSKNLSIVVLGDSDKLELTEEVIAIGYPLDLKGSATVSKGIASAFRNYGGVDYVQTDTAINPGNSGGPLITLKGEVIGINVLTIRVAGGLPIEGMNFAIAINSAKPIIPRLIAGESFLAPTSPGSPTPAPVPSVESFSLTGWKVTDYQKVPYLVIEFAPTKGVYLSLVDLNGLEISYPLYVTEGITGAKLRMTPNWMETPKAGKYSLVVKDLQGKLITTLPVADFQGAKVSITDVSLSRDYITNTFRISLVNDGDLPAYVTNVDIWVNSNHPPAFTDYTVILPGESASIPCKWYSGSELPSTLNIEIELKDYVGNVVAEISDTLHSTQ